MHAPSRPPSLRAAILALLACALACAPADGAARRVSVHGPPAAGSGTAASPTPLTLTVLDLPASVGGLSVLISDSSRLPPRHVLIDGGEHDTALRDRLRAMGVTELALIVLTHPHADHFGGLGQVVRELPVHTFAWNGHARTLRRFQDLLSALDASATQVVFVEDRPRTITLAAAGDSVQLTLLPPTPAQLNVWGDAVNNRSVGVRVERGRFRALVPGDAEHGQLDWWTRHYPGLLDADVLVASHHGSDDANATARRPRWYRTVTPAALLVSANGRQHPYANVLAFADAHGVRVYCTHTHGDLVVRVAADGGWAVTTSRPGPCTAGTLAPR